MSGIRRFTRGSRHSSSEESVGRVGDRDSTDRADGYDRTDSIGRRDSTDHAMDSKAQQETGKRTHVSPRPDIAPRFAIGIVAVIIIGSPVAAVFNLLQRNPSTAVTWGGIATLTALTALQLAHLARHDQFKRNRWGPPALAAQTLLVYTPFLWARNGWVGAPYFLSASTLLVLPRKYAWTVFGLVCVTIPTIHRSMGATWSDTMYYSVSTPTLGLAVFGLTRLAGLVQELYETRAELARLAVAQERLRFARDLHDLLGYSLSAITLKSELVYRLADRQTARAKQELESVLVLSRQALADVRAVSSSYREMSLGAECTSARSILSAADIAVRIDVVTDEMGGSVNTVLATVLREGVTNLLRHSKAQHCEIRAMVLDGTARLTIVNDGVRPAVPEPQTRRGTGIENLAQRVEVLGGGLEAGVGENGWYRLEAWVPLHLNGDEQKPDDEDADGPAPAGGGNGEGPGGTGGPAKRGPSGCADHTAA